MEKATIFLNYRHQTSEWQTELLYNGLLKYFSKNQIFKDYTTIEPGEDFIVAIEKALNKCDVLLVIIGKDWLNLKNSSGLRKLDDPADFVRIEIATALKRNIRVIPVLFDNIETPQASALPQDLEPLSRRQSITVSKINFDSDIARLADVINKIFFPGNETGGRGIPPNGNNQNPTTKIDAIIAFILLSIITIFYFICINSQTVHHDTIDIVKPLLSPALSFGAVFFLIHFLNNSISKYLIAILTFLIPVISTKLSISFLGATELLIIGIPLFVVSLFVINQKFQVAKWIMIVLLFLLAIFFVFMSFSH